MPRIPIYDTPQVQTNAIQPARANPGIASLAGAGEEALGKGLMAVSDYAAKVKDEADIMRAEEAFNKLREKQNQLSYGQEGAFNVKGGNVFNREKPFSQDYMGRLDTETQTIMQGLANDNQKRIFERAASRAKMEFGGQLSKHEAVEGAAYRESVFKGVLESEREHVTRNFNDPDSVAQSIQRVQANTRSYSMQQGLGADQQEMAVKEAVSGLHMTVIDRMLTGDKDRGIAADPMGAKKYYEDQVKAGAIVESSKEAKVMRGKIEADEREFVGMTKADEIWQGFVKDLDDNAPVNLDVMDQQLREQLKDNPDALKIARSELKDRASSRDYAIRQREASITGGIFKQVLEGKSLSEIRKSQEFRQLDGDRQMQMIEKITAFNKRGQDGEGGGSGGGDGSGGGRIGKFAVYYSYSKDPQRLMKMKDGEIFALAPQLGASGVERLIKERDKLLKGDDKVIAANIDNEQFNYWARQGGLNPSAKKGEDAERVGELKYRVETIIDQQQRERGGPLSRKDKDDIMKRLVVEVPVQYNQKVFGINTSGTMNKRLFEVQNPDAIIIRGADRDAVVKALQAVGIKKPTEAQIREGYVRLKAQ